MSLWKKLTLTFAMVLAILASPAAAFDRDASEVHRIVFQVSDNNPGTFTKVLNNINNLSSFFLERGEEYEIEVVAYNAGLHMLRVDTSDVLERVNGMAASVPNLTFSACGNTIQGMSKQAGKEIEITDAAGVVPGGIIRLMELEHQGYFHIRP